VRVMFLCYKNTMQAKCLRFMGKKLLVALTMEGKFAGEGLQTLDEDDDMLTSMAKELVEKDGIGESADSVWKQLNTEHRRLFPTRIETDDSTPVFEILQTTELETPVPSNGLIEAKLDSQSVLVFGQRPEELRSARAGGLVRLHRSKARYSNETKETCLIVRLNKGLHHVSRTHAITRAGGWSGEGPNCIDL